MQRRLWSAAETRALRDRYPNERAVDIARDLGRSSSQVYEKAYAMGLRKSEAFLASDLSGRMQRGRIHPAIRATQFRKGNVPWCKGTKGVVGVQAGCRQTQFTKGSCSGRAAQLYRPIGSERINKDGYLERKVHDGFPRQSRWRAVHILLWEEHLGPLPIDFAVTFKNGDRTDIRCDNLALTPRSLLMRRNSIHTRYPKDLTRLILLRGAVQRQIRRRERAEKAG